jgi:ATP-binding cassette subfamily F protein 3
MRLRLAAALLSKPDILLLDEPTNHLDLAGVLWLQEYISSSPECPQTLIIVSHDEAFLSAVATEVIIMKDKRLTYFSGSYEQSPPPLLHSFIL